MPKLFDVHAHVQFKDFDGDRGEVIGRALEAGVWMINVGTDEDSSKRAAELAAGFPEGVYATVGLHPNDSGKGWNRDFFAALAGGKKAVAVGECGLDYFRVKDGELRKRQKEVFIGHIRLAEEIKKPLMIHCRSAFDDLTEVLRSNVKSQAPGVVHFFSGSLDDAKNLLKMNFSFSFGGVVTFSRDYDEAIKYLPLENILLETDAPYVAPVPLRGKRNEPKNVEFAAGKIAEIKGVDYDEIAFLTTENARRIFNV